MPELSDQNRAVLNAIRAYYRDTGRSPSIRDLGDLTGLGTSTIHHHLRRLKADGAIRMIPRQPRSIELVDAAVLFDVVAELIALRSAYAAERVRRWRPKAAEFDHAAYLKACAIWNRNQPASARFITDHAPATADVTN